jgi:DNA-binding transcriptional LysR family regulator
MADLDPGELRYFQAIAQHGSLTAAARELGVTQPALSGVVRRLETRLRTTLFDRTREGVSLTTTGEELLHHTAEILTSLRNAEEAIRGLETADRGRFVVGCPESLGIYFLPPVVARCAREMPGVELALRTARSRDVEHAVVRRDVDFGVVARPLPHPDVVQVDLFRDRTALFVRRSAEKAAAAARRRLREGPLIYVEGLPQTQELLSKLDDAKMVPVRRLPCGSLELVAGLAREGVGVAVLPERVASHGSGLALLSATLPSVPDVIRLVYRGDWHRTRAALRLKDMIVEHARALERR